MDHLAQRIVEEALERHGAAREEFVRHSCGSNADLLVEVRSLLGAHAAAGEFLTAPTNSLVAATSATTLTGGFHVAPGTRIGPYKILQHIGEGGFGHVFIADQESPIQRRVALKVIKLGMDTRQVVARFEAERQALALMDHPNIARVLDGGATDAGRPYFVMELVKGEPITTYCDRNSLGIRERLELFVQVCKAVRHAHQKGIIHQDGPRLGRCQLEGALDAPRPQPLGRERGVQAGWRIDRHSVIGSDRAPVGRRYWRQLPHTQRP